MSRLEAAKKLVRRLFWSIPFFIVLSLILGGVISIQVIPKPKIATITISGTIDNQTYINDIMKMLKYTTTEDSIKAVVLQIDSPGGVACLIEQVYLEVLRLRRQKPVVASIGARGASGGYYIAVASNFIYAQPTSQLGSIGAWSSLPRPEELNEDTLTTGLFKATGGTKRRTTGVLEMVRQEFVGAVMSQRGDRLKLSEEELSRAGIYVGLEGLRHGLIDDIGTRTDATEKAASLAGISRYEVVEIYIPSPTMGVFFESSDSEGPESQASTMPIYYYLYFESE